LRRKVNSKELEISNSQNRDGFLIKEKFKSCGENLEHLSYSLFKINT